MVFVCGNPVSAQNHTAGYQFIENKGQWPDQVNFKADLKAGYLYLEEDGLLFNLYDPQTVNKYVEGHYNKELRKDLDVLRWHAYSVKFDGCNSNIQVESEGKSSNYSNYFIGNDHSNWASEAYAFNEVTYKNVYNGIDFKMYSQLFNLKYDFVVGPNADLNQIKLKYEGQNKLEVIKGRLHIYTDVNHIIEAKPIVYQVINGKRVDIKAVYVKEGNTIQYRLEEKYNKNEELIIDPTVVFSTYSGSFSNNFGYSATFDSQGFLYAGSSAFGNQYPTTVGAYNTSFNGGIVDIAIYKFDTTGHILI